MVAIAAETSKDNLYLVANLTCDWLLAKADMSGIEVLCSGETCDIGLWLATYAVCNL